MSGRASAASRSVAARSGRGGESRAGWTEHALHASLVRPTHYFGVERHVIALEGTLCLALVFGVGLSWATAALVALVVAILHPVMVWVTTDDAQATEIAVRSRAYADYYVPHAALDGQTPRPRPTLPRTR